MIPLGLIFVVICYVSPSLKWTHFKLFGQFKVFEEGSGYRFVLQYWISWGDINLFILSQLCWSGPSCTEGSFVRDQTNTIICSALHNWLPVNMSVVLHGAECGIDLAFVMMVSNQVKPLRWGSFHVYVRLLPHSSKRLHSSENHHVNHPRGCVLWIEHLCK